MIGAIKLGDSQTSENLTKMFRHQKTIMCKIFLRIIMVSLGAIIMALSLELFLVPNHIMDGGIVGISIITSHLLNFPLGIFNFILNLPFIFLGYKQIGKTFALSTGLGITVLSLATLLLHNIHPFTEDTLLATVFG
ncbi:MAG TPA: hypothetical protein DG757_19160, partial [Bacillus sp. (in: Bacteria)]|nr:hypothetical protein [Bacillus sp. (in: firmicutes)]